MTTSASPIERTFAMPNPARLTLLNVSGEINLQGVEGDTLTVTAVKHPGRGFDRTEIEMEQAADGAVRVATRYEDDIVSRLLGRLHSEPCRVDYTVRLPRAAALELSYVSGPAFVAGLNGVLDLQCVEGPLEVADLGGALRLKTVSGAIRALRLSLDEPLHVETVSGAVFVGDSRLPGLFASTVSGDLHLESGLSTGAYHVNSVSGELYLRLPADTQGTAHLSSLSGTLRSALPGLRRGGGAGVDIHVHSVSGNVHLAATGASAAPAAPPAAEARLALLDRVARGEVSVDDALKHLTA